MTLLIALLAGFITTCSFAHKNGSSDVAHITSAPSKSTILTTLSNFKRELPLSFTHLSDESVAYIQNLVRAFIKGSIGTIEKELNALQHHDQKLVEQSEQTNSLTRKVYTFISAKAPEVKEFALSLMPPLLSNAVASAAKGCIHAFSVVNHQKKLLQNLEDQQEKALLSLPYLRIAHEIASDKITKLLLILHSPSARSCDRMAALFLVNHSILLGKRGTLLQRYIERLNRYYFEPTGHLKRYDPDLDLFRRKRISSLVRFLSTIDSTGKLYLAALQAGIAMGIPEFVDEYQKAVGSYWKPRKARTFGIHATTFVQALTGSSVNVWKRINPALVRERTITRAFMALIELCIFNSPMNISSMQTYAQALIDKYRVSAPHLSAGLQRYYNESTFSY